MSDEEKKVNESGEGSKNPEEKKKISPLLIGFIAFDAVIFVAIIALLISMLGGKKDGGGSDVANNETTASSQSEPEEEPEVTTEDAAPEETTAKPEQSESASDPAKETTKDNTSETTKQQETPSQQPASGELTVTVNKTGGWGEGPVYSQLTIVIYNGTGQTVKGWTAKINVGPGVAIDQGWSGTYNIEGDTLVAQNVDYNGTLDPGQSCELGLIITNMTVTLAGVVEAGSTVPAPDYSQGNNNQGNNNQGNNGQGNQNTPGANPKALPVPEPTTNDWLHTDGRRILDAQGNEVWLTGVNWFGYNTGTNTFDGLWTSDLNTAIQAIADHGFNLIRIPISAELILQWKAGNAPRANFNNATNSYLVGMDSLEIFDYILGQFRACGLHVMMDIHSAKTDASGHVYNVWYNGDITYEKFQEAWLWLAERYKNDDTILAFDLKNEPHGKPFEGSGAAIWNDSTVQNNWKWAAQDTALKILEVNPNLLIMVEGIEIYPKDLETNGDFKSTDEKDYLFNWWGGNLRGVKDYPIDLGKYQSQLVYSPHDYGPTVYEQPWFKGSYDYDSLMADCWHDNWFYIYEDNTAPLLIGEWGGFMRDPNLKWMTYMRELIKKYRLNHTFWCFNANSGDTGGLVLDDFTTWDTEKYEFVKEVLWQENGKFVGLDHDIPLGTGGNGISLGELYK